MIGRRFGRRWLIRLAMRFRRERDEARAERDELRSRIGHNLGPHYRGEDFGGARE